MANLQRHQSQSKSSTNKKLLFLSTKKLTKSLHKDAKLRNGFKIVRHEKETKIKTRKDIEGLFLKQKLLESS